MKLDLDKVSEHGSFSIEPTEGWTIVWVFIDFETKLVIVNELAARAAPGAKAWDPRPGFVTTIDAAARRIIPPGERASRIDYSEKIETDEEFGLKSVSRRELDADSGSEFFDEKLYDHVDTLLSSARRTAFGPSKMPNILDAHRRRLRQEAPYVQKSLPPFEDRVAYWSGQIQRGMRSQSEFGLDEYGKFTPAWYERSKRVDPEFDEILTFLFERYEAEFTYVDCDTDEILRRIGKPELVRSKAKPKGKRK